MMEASQFGNASSRFDAMEPTGAASGTSDTFRVKLYGKLHFLKRLKPAFAADIRYVEAQRKEFETGYRLEHPNIVRYISLTDDGILMEYIDGETLAERLASHPEYFNRQNSDKLLRQLLDAVGYLHSHQVLHLDLKPDNILLTRINSDVKLVDLGCCYTDTFADTQGHTLLFAAPEQRSGGVADERTDIYAVGRILEQLPAHHFYNKVIARCTAENPDDRYQSVNEMAKAVSRRRKPYRSIMALALTVALIAFGTSLFVLHDNAVSVTDKTTSDTSAVAAVAAAPERSVSKIPADSAPRPTANTSTTLSEESSVTVAVDETMLMERELDRLLDVAYRSTIVTFCDSVFPSLTVGRQWSEQSSEFHAQVLQVAADLSRKYPDIPESVIQQHVESRFQALVGYVFNRMRENGKKASEDSLVIEPEL